MARGGGAGGDLNNHHFVVHKGSTLRLEAGLINKGDARPCDGRPQSGRCRPETEGDARPCNGRPQSGRCRPETAA